MTISAQLGIVSTPLRSRLQRLCRRPPSPPIGYCYSGNFFFILIFALITGLVVAGNIRNGALSPLLDCPQYDANRSHRAKMAHKTICQDKSTGLESDLPACGGLGAAKVEQAALSASSLAASDKGPSLSTEYPARLYQ